MKISKELIKGSTAMLVMSVLKKNDMYGYKIIKELELQSESMFELKEVLSTPFFTHLKKKICLKATGKNLTAESVNTTTSPAKAQNALKKSRRNGKYIENQSKKFSAFQVCKTLITDRPFSVNLEFIAL